TLTSQHATKALHRWAEQALVEAELWAATDAVRTGAEYPTAQIDRLWETVLLHEFHDILPGTSIAWVHREASEVLSRVIDEAQTLAGSARRSLAGDGDRELRFVPSSVGEGRALGAAFLEARAEPDVALAEEGDGWRLENDLVSVLISAEGLIVSAVDRASGREVVAEGRAANLFQLHQDFPNMWDAWDIDKYYRNSVEDLTGVASITASVIDGVATVVVTRAFSESTVEQTITLAPASRTVELRNVIDWHETEKLLKLAFPLDIQATHTEAETQFGYQSRVTHTNTSWEAAKFETSMHRFVLVREQDFGVALVNDSIYGYDTSREVSDDAVATTVRLSLLRAPRFPDPDTDHGPHEIAVGFVIGADAAIATAEGITMNSPAAIVRGSREVDPLVSVHGEGIVVSGVKLADDGSGDVIVRLYEALGRRAIGSITAEFDHREIREVSLIEDALDDARVGGELRLRPFEVRTLRIVR
ncbi:glycoside hydrolase family 38 C-terminal domain-containing protein, partial [Microbacterium sp. NPDC097977]|uniref:glycoside hydrolase family 38 C-terminal domain-containing protein n=1 Tax=Microbacterium sp. NPDC097977 TaxID=3155686 RepID=UPI0033339A34